jgi:hypothetical protein
MSKQINMLLPIELWRIIFLQKNLSWEDYDNLKRCCRQFYNILDDSAFWHIVSLDGFQDVIDDARFSILMSSNFSQLDARMKQFKVHALDLKKCSQLTDWSFCHFQSAAHNIKMLDLSDCLKITDYGLIQCLKACRKIQVLNLRSLPLITTDCIGHIISFCTGKP